MRLYTTDGATQIGTHPVYGGPFTPNADGAFDGLPEGLFAELYGRPGWETEDERAHRLASEELDRFRDPAELLKAVRELGANQGLLTQALATALGLGSSQTPPAVAPATEGPSPQAPAPPTPESRAGDAPPTPAPPAETPPPPAPRRSRKSSAGASADA